jgi:hypothetical protein
MLIIQLCAAFPAETGKPGLRDPVICISSYFAQKLAQSKYNKMQNEELGSLLNGVAEDGPALLGDRELHTRCGHDIWKTCLSQIWWPCRDG